MSGRAVGAGGTATPGRRAFDGPVRHVYVHVPFCRAKCDYCDFASVPVGDPGEGRAGAGAAHLFDDYVDGIAAEWERERAAHDVRRLRTLYLGGGTPSLLGPDRLERLVELFRPHLTPHAEVTVETNPEDVDNGYAEWAAAGPVAGAAGAARGLRVSLGVQSFLPRQREAVGRRSTTEPARAFRRLRAAGVANLGVDLMHGLPGQSLTDLGADLGAVLLLRPDHISWYELGVAECTPLAERLMAGGRSGSVAAPESGWMPDAGPGSEGAPLPYAGPLPDADLAAQLFDGVVRGLSRAGYDWYEVSNFALPGRRARHNVAYWRARPYLGLGPGAVSTVGARRWTNAPAPAAWAAALAAGASPPREVEELSAATRAKERLLLAARCGDRVPLAELTAAVDPEAAAPLARAGLVSLHSGTIRVTRKGRHVANEVCVRLFRTTHLRG